MLGQTDIERERYEARRKMQLNYNTGLKVARMEGEMIGTIRTCERLLQRPQSSAEELERMSLEALTRLAESLQEQLLKRS